MLAIAVGQRETHGILDRECRARPDSGRVVIEAQSLTSFPLEVGEEPNVFVVEGNPSDANAFLQAVPRRTARLSSPRRPATTPMYPNAEIN